MVHSISDADWLENARFLPFREARRAARVCTRESVQALLISP